MDGERLVRPGTDPLYLGKQRWNMNPKEGVNGHLLLVDDVIANGVDVRVGVRITIFDRYDRPHKLLPVSYVYSRNAKEWWFDPVDPAESPTRRFSVPSD